MMTCQEAGGSKTAAGLEETLPASYYLSSEAFVLEKKHIFFREWVCVCREEEIPTDTRSMTLDVMGEGILLVRNKLGKLKAFYNVCRHRGSTLCTSHRDSKGSDSLLRGGVIANDKIMCPYHSWTYDFDGALISAPHLSGVEGLDRAAFSLYPVGVATWGGFVFLNLSPESAQPLSAQLGDVVRRTIRYPLPGLRIGKTIQYKVKANWKVIVENYNECYHCAGVHPELCAVVPAFRKGGMSLDWESGIPHRPGAYTFTKTGTTHRRAFPGLDDNEKIRHKGELVYPNLLVSLACDHVAAFIIRPIDADNTDITCHFLFEETEIASPSYDPSDTVDFWDLVNRQDWEVCERVQQGMRSRAYRSGYYAPMEDVNLDMRRYIWDRVGMILEDGTQPK